MNQKNLLRMLPWLLLSACCYAAAVVVSQPQLQTGLWKAGHITAGAYLGYWIDRHLFGPVDRLSGFKERMAARAIVVAAAILGMAFGL